MIDFKVIFMFKSTFKKIKTGEHLKLITVYSK